MLPIAFLLAPALVERPLYQPTATELVANYRRADAYVAQNRARAFRLDLRPQWIDAGTAFWYRRESPGGISEYVRVRVSDGSQTPLFDSAKVAEELRQVLKRPVDTRRLPIQNVRVDEKIRFDVDRRRFELDSSQGRLREIDYEAPPRPNPPTPWRQNTWPPERDPRKAPDDAWTARIEGWNVVVRAKDGAEKALTTDGTEQRYYARLQWSADSRRIVAVVVKPGDRNKVFLIQNSPPEWGPAKLSERIYDRPGDRVDRFEIVILDPNGVDAPKVVGELDYGGLPWLRPTRDGAFTYERMDRGYGRWRIFRLDPSTGQQVAVIDDDPPTFVDSTSQMRHYFQGSNEILFSSERSGWRHLYLADGQGGEPKPVTRGDWVVRSLIRVDEAQRKVIFSASGVEPDDDPYYQRVYSMDLTGENLVCLTPGPGNHTAVFSPDHQVLIDTASTVAMPPVHTLRNAQTGAAIAVIDRADVSELEKHGWTPPQKFVAKGRDGKTDIYGLVFRPTHFDPKKRYPIVEDLYAGPHDSFVPKSFSPAHYDQAVAELGFIVVKIDGMGTRNRSKAFHDICYQNLRDAGLPDRILWMKALAKVEPSADVTRVGVFGTSAGGQSSTGALLFHPEFYKVAVSSCGCHDNRLDKIWWNEQWMGLMGPHYAENSNITHAKRLRGELMLIVGELDTNVPPESTYRLAAALHDANREFELVIIPNAEHTSGGPYGERKRRDFLVRHLLGVQPPNPNRIPLRS